MDFDRKPADALGLFQAGSSYPDALLLGSIFFHRNEPQPFCPVMHSLKGQGSFIISLLVLVLFVNKILYNLS